MAELLQQSPGHVLDQRVGHAKYITRRELTCSVNPIYYVGFTTCTIIASAILFQGFNTTGGVNTVSLLCGFLIIFMGVYLLNISRQAEPPHHATSLEAGLMSALSSFHLANPFHSPTSVLTPDPRMSMSGRLSIDSNGPQTWNYASVPGNTYAPDGSLHSAGHGRRSSIYRAQNSTLFTAFEEGDGMPLSDLPEEEESDDERRGGGQGRSLVGKNSAR
jgi:hypothetical protein